MLTRLALQFEVLTPLFLGGANGEAQLRAPSIKGALRHWYRAIDAEYKRNEFRLFGGTNGSEGEGQALMLLRTRGTDNVKRWNWDDAARDIQRGFQVGRGKEAKNGVAYLGYTLGLRGNGHRNALAVGTKFNLECVIPRFDRLTSQDRCGLLAALWLLSHLGSLGTRARRGFGSLHLTDWEASGAGRQAWLGDMERLPLLSAATDVGAWRAQLGAALRFIDEKFHFSRQQAPHPRLGPDFQVAVLRAPPVRAAPETLGWAAPLQTAGLLMQTLRAGHEPDRRLVREHLLAVNHRDGVPLIRQSPMQSPERVAFGLPLSFRFIKPSGLNPNTVEFTPNAANARGEYAQRHPSPLWIRTTRIGREAYAVITRLDGALPGSEGVRYTEQGRGSSSDSRTSRRQDPLPAPEGGLLEVFMDKCARQGVRCWPGDAS